MLALQITDLGAFVALGLATLVIALVVAGLTMWLRDRGRKDDDEKSYYAGL